MGQRIQLQALLEQLLGSRNVYFQPPPSTKMQYPCIVYRKDDIDTIYSGNKPYRNVQRYTVTVIDKNPDSFIPAKIAGLPMSTFDRFFVTDNLNHDVFKLYF